MLEVIFTVLLGWCGYYQFKNKRIGLGFLYMFTAGLFFVGWINDIFSSIQKYIESLNINIEHDDEDIEMCDYVTSFKLICDEDWEEAFGSVIMDENFSDMDSKYVLYHKNKELMILIKNFVFKKLQTGLYLEYYESFDVDIIHFLSRYKFKNKEIEKFFITNYADGNISSDIDSIFKSRIDYLENIINDSIIELSEQEKILNEQMCEFYKFFTYLSDMNLIEKTAASKLTLLIIVNELYKEKIKTEYVDFINKYNIDEGLSNEEIIKSFITDNQYFSQSKLAEMMAIKNYNLKKSLTTQILSFLFDVKTVCEIVQKENYLKNLAINNRTTRTTIYEIDIMSGDEFEQFIAKLFRIYGYKIEVTKTTGDQGIDILAEKDGKKYGIQAKCYSSPVGNHAIMEVVAGANYYGVDHIMVVTNSTFTKSAIELAKKNNVHLWDRKILIEKINYGIC